MKRGMKLLSLILAIVMVFALAVGCTKTEPEASASPGTSPSVTPSASPDASEETVEKGLYPVTEDVITLSVYQAVGGFLLPYLQDDGWNVWPTAQRAEEVTNVHMEWFPFEQDLYAERFSIMLASDEYPDMISQPEKHYQGGADALVADDICINLRPLMDTYAPDFVEKVYSQYDTYAKQITTDSGNIVSICTITESIPAGPIIRMDWLNQLNLEVPTTYDDIHDVLLAFKTELNVKHPMVIQANMSYSNHAFSAGMDVGIWRINDLTWQVDNEGKVVATCMTPQFKDYLMMLNQWFSEGLLTDASLTYINERYFEEPILAGETGFWAAGTNAMSSDFAARSDDPNFSVYPIPEPTPTGTEALHMGPLPYTLNDASGWAVSTQCEYPEAALSYINWFFTDEGFERSNFGEQGVAYTVDANGKKQFTDLIMNDPEIPSMFAQNLYASFTGGQPGIMSRERSEMSYSTDAQRATQTVWGLDTVPKDNSHMYYGNLTAEESIIYSARAGDINTLVDENLAWFVFGIKSFDEYDAFIATVESLGIAELTAVKQAAYTRFMNR